DLNTFLDKTKNDPFYWELRAVSHAALGKGAQAEADRKAARDNLKPGDAEDLNNKAWKMVVEPNAQWDPEYAEALARHATALAPLVATCWNTLGVAQYRLGRYPEAINSLYKSLELREEDPEVVDLYFLAMCHAKQGNLAAAQACFAQAVRWE